MSPDRTEFGGEPIRPTRARFQLALWLCGLSGILYLDRICMAQAIPPFNATSG